MSGCGTARVDDIGRKFVINANFDLSGNTELRMIFKKPDGTVVEKLTADGVSAPAVPWVGKLCPEDEEDTTFEANKYWEYASESGLLDAEGDWTKHGEYVDGTPKDLAGDVTTFPVLPRE
jgi:hypothetical protein